MRKISLFSAHMDLLDLRWSWTTFVLVEFIQRINHGKMFRILYFIVRARGVGVIQLLIQTRQALE